MLRDIVKRIKRYQPNPILFPSDFKEAAVLIPIIKKPQPELLLTLRANNLTTHSGEVAFPGGKRDPEDKDLLQTALRESAEEIALPSKHIELIGSLQTLVSKHNVKVTPYVALVDDAVHYQPNLQEIATIFTVPLEYFKEDPRTVTHRIDYLDRDWYVPCYYYQQFKIWGLTAIMIAELMNVIYGTTISFHSKPTNSRFIDYKDHKD